MNIYKECNVFGKLCDISLVSYGQILDYLSIKGFPQKFCRIEMKALEIIPL